MDLFWLDISALVLSSIITLSLTLMIVGANATALLNLSFGAFTLLQGGWAAFALLMKLSLWLRMGTPLVFGEMAALMLVLSTPFLFIFTVHYLAIENPFWRKFFHFSAFGGIAITVVVSVLFLFSHRVLRVPRLLANGTTSIALLTEGIGMALGPFVFLIWSVILFWLKRNRIKEYYLPSCVLIFTVGYIAGGLLDAPVPVLSFTNLLSVGILGYGVVRKQLFNPLRAINLHLEESIRLRTEELKQAYAEVEKRVDERTKELTIAISNHKKTEEILRESEEKFRNLAEESPNMIFINKNGQVVYVNPKCVELMGYSKEEFYSPQFDFRSLIMPEYIPAIEHNFTQHLAGEDVKPYEYELCTKTGKKIVTIITSRLIHYAGELAILGIVTDITQQKRAERLLMNLNEVALSLMHCLTPREVWSVVGRSFKQLNLCCCILERNQEKNAFLLRYLSQKNKNYAPVSEIAEFFINEEDDKLNTIPLASLFSLNTFFENKLPVFRQEALNQPAEGAINASEQSAVVNDALFKEYIEQFFYLPNILFLPLSHELETFGLLMLQSEELQTEDVPAYTAFSYQLAASWHKSNLLIELTRSINELKLAQEELLHSQKMEVIGRLAGNVAHDFNNILTVINSYTQLLYVSLKDNEQALGDIKEIRNATTQAAQLTNQLLALCKKKNIQPVVLDVNHTIADMKKMLEHILGEKIALTIELCSQKVQIKADPGQVEQIMMNLIVNARDALLQGEGGKVVIASELLDLSKSEEAHQLANLNFYLKPGIYTKLIISDNGQGMDEETQNHIFEPFFTTKAANKGIGLGLAIVYSIVKQNNGYINVDSAPGQGTIFTIYFPYYVCNS